jgi:hypothetical protein
VKIRAGQSVVLVFFVRHQFRKRRKIAQCPNGIVVLLRVNQDSEAEG